MIILIFLLTITYIKQFISKIAFYLKYKSEKYLFYFDFYSITFTYKNTVRKLKSASSYKLSKHRVLYYYVTFFFKNFFSKLHKCVLVLLVHIVFTEEGFFKTESVLNKQNMK